MTRRESRSTLKVEAYPEYYEVIDGFFRQKEIEEYITKVDPEFTFQDPTDLRKVDSFRYIIKSIGGIIATENERSEGERQMFMHTGPRGLRLYKEALQAEARRLFAGQAREFPIIVDEVFRHNPVEIPIEQEVVETIDYNTLTESQILEYFDRLSHNEE